jgi:hypothetical protein
MIGQRVIPVKLGRKSPSSEEQRTYQGLGNTAFGREDCGQMVNDPTGRKGLFQSGDG